MIRVMFVLFENYCFGKFDKQHNNLHQELLSWHCLIFSKLSHALHVELAL